MTDEGIWAWHRAYLEHRKRVRGETARYAAECAEIRDLHGPACRGSSDRSEVSARGPAWYQGDFDELDYDPSDDEVIFRQPDGTWFAADAAQYLPPCEMTGLAVPDRDALDKAIGDHAEPEPGDMLTAWVLVAEWVALDGTKRLTRLSSSPITTWGAAGMLHEALHGDGWDDA